MIHRPCNTNPLQHSFCVAYRHGALLGGLLLGSLLFSLPGNAEDYDHNGITIAHPHIASTPPGAKTAAGYATLVNTTESPDRLTGGQASFADRLEIHRTEVVDDVSRMREMENGVSLEAGTTVSLMPGDMHLMFVGLKEPLVEGEMRAVTLEFERAGEVTIDFMVQRMTGEMPNHEGMEGMEEDMDGMKH